MAKTDIAPLADAVTEQLLTYLQRGTIRPTALASPELLETYNVENLNRVLSIHFVLQDDVIEYLAQLSDRLRRVKTEARSEHVLSRSEVAGRIDWERTYRERIQRGHNDRSLFATSNPSPVADIPENRVLTAFLARLREPISMLSTNEYAWSSAYESDVATQVTSALDRHVLLSELSTEGHPSVTGRELTKARQSRHDLYSEAARLYQLFEDLHDGHFERAPVRRILAETFIVPRADHQLYELFCVFRILKALTAHNDTVELQSIEGGRDEIARLHTVDGSTMHVYWDQTGPYTFSESLPDADALTDTPLQIRRYTEARIEAAETAAAFLGTNTSESFYQGRPDLIIDHYDADDTLREVLLGEFKYSTSAQRFRSGVRELREYIRFARTEGGYLDDNENVAVHGILCTDRDIDGPSRIDDILHLHTATLQQSFQRSRDTSSKSLFTALESIT